MFELVRNPEIDPVRLTGSQAFNKSINDTSWYHSYFTEPVMWAFVFYAIRAGKDLRLEWYVVKSQPVLPTIYDGAECWGWVYWLWGPLRQAAELPSCCQSGLGSFSWFHSLTVSVTNTGKTNTSFGDCFGIDQRDMIYTKAIPKARVCFACGHEVGVLELLCGL